MLPDFLFCSFFPVQQTTSGIGHRVKWVFRVGNQYAECEKQQQQQQQHGLARYSFFCFRSKRVDRCVGVEHEEYLEAVDLTSCVGIIPTWLASYSLV